ncbi:MAG: hypothetical protein A2X18_05070 [Bacteroidetes bacterium GWF2_40_14]|nr:MAG: hypothetical protein A2X18_05070 [Bacteroidetes bacterium GWF2_40_14]
MSTNITKKSKVTPPPHGYINEIAKILGCHRVTVSNALMKNTKGTLSERVRQMYKMKFGKESDDSASQSEECNRLRTLLADMSHEIRTPMNGILGFADLMKSTNLTLDERHRYIRIIEDCGARILHIVNDIICISKIESGQMTVCLSETNIKERIEFICAFFRPETERKGIMISADACMPENESTIITDKEKINAILMNLVKNAVKYSDKGTIALGCKRKDSYIEFYVKDTGIGIPKESHQAIFNRFVQADTKDKRTFSGAGLGLSIVKSYVEMLGGKIWIDSETGKGSTFYFTIPYNRNL